MDEERKPTWRRLYTVFLDTVKITDVFATHVNLNYKGQSTFKTVIGGTTTIVIFIGKYFKCNQELSFILDHKIYFNHKRLIS